MQQQFKKIAAFILGLSSTMLASESRHQPQPSFEHAIKETVTADNTLSGLREAEIKSLYRSALPNFGPKDAQNTVLLFIDPYCLHCHDALKLYKRYAEQNKGILRVIIHYLPLAGGLSYLATLGLLAAHLQGKHEAFANILGEQKKIPNNLAELRMIAEKAKINLEEFEQDLAINKKGGKKIRGSDRLRKMMRESTRILTKVKPKIDATPSFICLNKRTVEIGLLSPEELLEHSRKDATRVTPAG